MMVNYLTKAFFGVCFCSLSVSAAAAKSYVCAVDDNINHCLQAVSSGTVVLENGLHLTDGIFLQSDITLVIPAGAIVRFSPDAHIDGGTFGGVSRAVVSAIGSKDEPLKNVHLRLDGEIDGNKSHHPYEQGGYEGINFKFVESGSITGRGIVHSANGDGVDIDASQNLLIAGITSSDHDGSGVHFGAPRPIAPSKWNIVSGVTSKNNGFLHQRNGFDLSWPNPAGAQFYKCIAIGNFRNWDIQTSSFVVRSESHGGQARDIFKGGGYTEINSEIKSSWTLIAKKTRVLIKRDIKKLLGIQYPSYLDEVTYR